MGHSLLIHSRLRTSAAKEEKEEEDLGTFASVLTLFCKLGDLAIIKGGVDLGFFSKQYPSVVRRCGVWVQGKGFS